MHEVRELTADDLSTVYAGAQSKDDSLPHPQPSPWDRLVHGFAGLFR
jgi:hypothetical protein